MGLVQTAAKQGTTSEILINKLTYVHEEHFPDLGVVHIYRKKQKPYDYYIKISQTCIDSQNTRDNIEKKLSLYRQFQGCNSIVQLQANFVKQQIQLCANLLSLDVYFKYHNFNLFHAIQEKIINNKKFPQSNLLFIMLCLLKAGDKFKDLGGKHYLGIFKCDKIYLSTDGRIKIYPFHLASINNNSSLSYCDKVNEVYIQYKIRQSGNQKVYKTYKDDIKDIASVIFRLIHKNNINKQEFNQHQLQQTRIDLSKIITPKLLKLLNQMLNQQNGCSYQLIISQLTRMKQEDGYRFSDSIRLEEDAQNIQEVQERTEEQEMSNQTQKQITRSTAQSNVVPLNIFKNSRFQQRK